MNKTFSQMIREMSLFDFITRFGSLLDMLSGERRPVKLWPKQRGLARAIEDFTKKLLFILKARQLGGSELLAFYCVKILVSEPSAEILIVSKDGDEAEYFIERRVLPILQSLPVIAGLRWPSIASSTKTSIVMSNGAKIDSLNTSSDAGRGRTVRLAIVDEAAAKNINDVADQLYSSISPTVEKHPHGQLIFMSTSKPGSWFQDMVKKIYDRKILDATLAFMPWNTDPSRTSEWYERERAKYASEVDFLSEYPSTIADVFHSKSGLVYSSFCGDPDDPKTHVKEILLDWSQQFAIAFDWGFKHPACLLMCLYDKYTDHLHVFDEIYQNETEPKEWAHLISERLQTWKKIGAPHPQRRIADGQIFQQVVGARSIADIFREESQLIFTKAKKSDEGGSRALLISRFHNRSITIHPRCVNLRRELSELRWKTTKTKKELTQDLNNDAIDPLRYLCAELLPGSSGIPEEPRHRPEFNNAVYRELKDSVHSESGVLKSDIDQLWGL